MTGTAATGPKKTTDPKKPDGPKKRMRGPARRGQILVAAVEVFAAKGYSAASMGDIGEAAEVARPVLYDHFASKQVLYLNVLAEQNAALIAQVGAGIQGSGGPRRRMRATIEAFFTFAEQHPAARTVLYDHTDEGDPEIEAVRRGYWDTRIKVVTSMLGEDLKRVGVDPGSVEAELTVELLTNGLNGLARWWLRHPGTSRATLVSTAERLLWKGMARFDEPSDQLS
ncbi:TetR/AcrR family transcriptional regulator [Streptomyces sp. KR80]|uniref:TetR/AcrR family transcriptional regulator n=1 Tax=Streptomyces sp. KR80 TaxID=3457426 RepID=UPI003FD40899